MESCVLYTGVKATLMRRVLFRGILWGSIGILGLILSAILLSHTEMALWGPFLFCAGMTAIVIGLLPYRRLTRLESHPDKLSVDSSSYLTYFSKGKKVFTIPSQVIKEILYIDRDSHYGIGIRLNPQSKEKICVHRRHFDMKTFQEKSQRDNACDLFFPYFTQRSFQQLSGSLEWK